jgi:hypothetical protein
MMPMAGTNVAGFHVAYGLALGLTFDAFTRRERRR